MKNSTIPIIIEQIKKSNFANRLNLFEEYDIKIELKKQKNAVGSFSYLYTLGKDGAEKKENITIKIDPNHKDIFSAVCTLIHELQHAYDKLKLNKEFSLEQLETRAKNAEKIYINYIKLYGDKKGILR